MVTLPVINIENIEVFGKKGVNLRSILDEAKTMVDGNVERAMANVGTLVMLGDSHRHFPAEGAFGGHAKWAELSEFTKEKRAERGNSIQKILQDTGRLRNSIHVMKATQDDVVVGTELEYALIHQIGEREMLKKGFDIKNKIEGTGLVPPRPFMFFAPDGSDLDRIRNVFITGVLEQIIK